MVKKKGCLKISWQFVFAVRFMRQLGRSVFSQGVVPTAGALNVKHVVFSQGAEIVENLKTHMSMYENRKKLHPQTDMTFFFEMKLPKLRDVMDAGSVGGSVGPTPVVHLDWRFGWALVVVATCYQRYRTLCE